MIDLTSMDHLKKIEPKMLAFFDKRSNPKCPLAPSRKIYVGIKTPKITYEDTFRVRRPRGFRFRHQFDIMTSFDLEIQDGCHPVKDGHHPVERKCNFETRREYVGFWSCIYAVCK